MCNDIKKHEKNADNHWYLNTGNYPAGFGFGSMVSGLFLLIIFFLLTFALSSCEDVVEVKLNDENMNLFGVEATITTTDEPTVFLYKTLQLDHDEAYPGISGALITLSDDASPVNQITLVEDAAKKGWYTVPKNSSFKGVRNREYLLKIQSEGTTLVAKDKLSAVGPIDSIQVKPSMRGNGRFLGVFTYGKDPVGIGNFYKWDIFINGSIMKGETRLIVASDKLVDGNYISNLEIFTDFYEPDKEETDRKIKLNDVVQVKKMAISEFAYNFYYQMNNQRSTGSLFSVPPANIIGNFTSSDGKPVLGLFTACDVAVSVKVLINQKLEDQLKKRK